MTTHKFFPKVNYTPKELEYLHSEKTFDIWNKICDYIKHYRSKNIVDIGCATGAINHFLQGYTYNYYGIDKSPLLIEEANNTWKLQENIKFEFGDWNTTVTECECDCLLLLGVLPYSITEYGYTNNDTPWDMYNRLMKKYNPKQVIIRETVSVQDGEPLDIPTVDLKPFLEIATNVEYITVNTILGDKVLIHVTR